MPAPVDYVGSLSPQSSVENSPFFDRDPKDATEKIAFVEGRANVYNYYLHSLHRQWYEAVLWYVGEHYLEFNWAARRFSLKTFPNYIPRATTNQIFPKCEVGVQLFLEAFPDAVVKPQSRQIEDRQAAEVAQHIRRHLWRENLMEMKMREAGVWTVVTGNCFMLDYLDNANKETARIPVERTEEEPILDNNDQMIPAEGPDGEIIMQGDGVTPMPLTETRRVQERDESGELVFKEIPLTDVNTMVITPFEIIPDFGARHPWEMRNFVHFRSFDLDYLKTQFGADATKNLKAEQAVPLNTYYQFKILDLIARSDGQRHFGLHGGVSGADQTDWMFMRNSAILKTYFEIPSDRHPKGRIYAVANGQLLFDGPYSDLYGEKLNLHQFRWSVLPGSHFAFGMVKNLIDPQKRLNGLDTQRALIRKTMGNPAWLIPVGAKFRDGLGTSEPGHVYFWKKNPTGQPPVRLDPKQPPIDLEIERKNLLRDMNDISGIMSVLAGENPPGVTAGISLDILTEAAGKRFLPIVRENRETFRRMEMSRLSIAQKAPAWSLPRLIAVLGDDGDMEAKRFQNTDFKGSYDVYVEAVNPSLFSATQKRADVVQAINLGLISLEDHKTREQARKDLNVGGYDDPVSADMKIALYENSKLLAGDPVSIGAYDDSGVHHAIHQLLFKRTDFENLPQPTIQNMIDHMGMHEQVMKIEADLEFKDAMKMAQIEAAGRPSSQPPKKSGGGSGKQSSQAR